MGGREDVEHEEEGLCPEKDCTDSVSYKDEHTNVLTFARIIINTWTNTRLHETRLKTDLSTTRDFATCHTILFATSQATFDGYAQKDTLIAGHTVFPLPSGLYIRCRGNAQTS